VRDWDNEDDRPEINLPGCAEVILRWMGRVLLTAAVVLCLYEAVRILARW